MNFKKNIKIISTVMTCLIIIAVIGVNFLFSVLGSKVNMNIDLTKSKVMKVSQLTKDTIDNLKEDVRIISLIPQDAADAYGIYDSMDLLLKKYDNMSSKITYTRVNTEKEPTIFQKYKDTSGNDATQDSIIFETDKTYRVVDIATVASITNNMVLFGGEQLFTSAIELVTGGKEITIYVTEGHNEVANAEFMSSVFSGQPFVIKNLNLMEGGVPEDASLLMILSPQNDFLSEEIDALDKYVSNGGDLIVAAPNELNKNTEKLSAYLSEFGVSFSNAYVVEESTKNYFNNMPMCIIPEIANTKITEALYNSNSRVATIYSQAINVTSAENVQHNVVLSSSEKSYLKGDINSITYSEGDKKGPFTLALYATKMYDGNKNADMLFLGNSYYLHNTFLNDTGFANKTFLTNSVKVLTGSTSLLSIGPKDMTPSTIAIDASQANFLTILVIAVIPLAILLAGFIVWIRRKNL